MTTPECDDPTFRGNEVLRKRVENLEGRLEIHWTNIVKCLKKLEPTPAPPPAGLSDEEALIALAHAAIDQYRSGETVPVIKAKVAEEIRAYCRKSAPEATQSPPIAGYETAGQALWREAESCESPAEEEAQREYDNAPESPLSKGQINGIVERVVSGKPPITRYQDIVYRICALVDESEPSDASLVDGLTTVDEVVSKVEECVRQRDGYRVELAKLDAEYVAKEGTKEESGEAKGEEQAEGECSLCHGKHGTTEMQPVKRWCSYCAEKEAGEAKGEEDER